MHILLLLAKTLKSERLWIQCSWLWGSDQFKRKYCIAAGTFALKWKWTCMIRDTKIKRKVLQEIPWGKPQIDLLDTQKKNSSGRILWICHRFSALTLPVQYYLLIFDVNSRHNRWMCSQYQQTQAIMHTSIMRCHFTICDTAGHDKKVSLLNWICSIIWDYRHACFVYFGSVTRVVCR